MGLFRKSFQLTSHTSIFEATVTSLTPSYMMSYTELDGTDLEHRIVAFEAAVSNIRKDQEIKVLREKLQAMKNSNKVQSKQVQASQKNANQLFVRYNLERKLLADATQAQTAELDTKAKQYTLLMTQLEERTLEIEQLSTKNQQLMTKIRELKQNMPTEADSAAKLDGDDLERRIVAFEMAVSNSRKDQEIKMLREKLQEVQDRKYKQDTEDTFEAKRTTTELKGKHCTRLVAQVEERTFDLLAKMQQKMLENDKRLESCARRAIESMMHRPRVANTGGFKSKNILISGR